MAKANLLIEDYAGVLVVTFTDSSILDTGVIEQIGKDLYQLTDEQCRQKLILDFSNVKFLSSQALGILLMLHKKAAAIKGEVVLCALRPELKKIFTITSLDKVFKFFPDDVGALASFGVRLQ
ncbi:MAG TPA: STAS domain-containing protein [Phycisphaerae bacterium]|nr:STAS domain-containing protein [Phycisphaerae bacterium]